MNRRDQSHNVECETWGAASFLPLFTPLIIRLCPDALEFNLQSSIQQGTCSLVPTAPSLESDPVPPSQGWWR